MSTYVRYMKNSSRGLSRVLLFFISLVPRSIKNYGKPELRYRFVWVANSFARRAQLFFILYIKIFVQYIVFFVHLTYNIIITEKEMIIWLEPQQTSASAWIQI